MIQVLVFILLTSLVGFVTYQKCKGKRGDGSSKDYFLAGGGLSWVYVAGSILLTNISAEQIVGMNGPQMFLVAWWEFYAAIGLLILARFFIPIYYKHKCITTTQLLEEKFGDPVVRGMVSGMFLFGYMFILLPSILYTGSLFMKSMFGLEMSIVVIAILFAIVGGIYAVFGGLRAIAISDTFNGVGLLVMGSVVTLIALFKIDFDFSGIPAERLTLLGDSQSSIPWPTLLTGMVFIQIFYWCTNMVITQRALAAKNVREAQKGIYAAVALKIFIPFIVVLPGIISYKLYGKVGDVAYGRLVSDLLPSWLSGAFAAVIAGAVLSSFNSCLNSASALYVVDIHQKFFNPNVNVVKVGSTVAITFAILAISLVPVYQNAESIIGLVQQLNGLYSMPVLAAFIMALGFQKMNPIAVRTSIVFGAGLYAIFTFVWSPLHYIHLMAITLFASCGFCLLLNKVLARSPEPASQMVTEEVY